MSGLPRAAVLALCLSALAAGALLWLCSPSAEAGREDPCHDSAISAAVHAATGNAAVDHVCNPALYGGGQWATDSELRGYVDAVMDSCGPGGTNRNLTQAVIEITGVVPRGAVCAKGIYQASYEEACQSGCGGIDWTIYKGEAGFEEKSAWDAVNATLHTCSNPVLTQGLIERTGALPDRRMDSYSYWHSGGSQASGQCSGTLYNHYGWYSYGNLVGLIDARLNAPTCSNAEIEAAFAELTGWSPLSSECDARRYVAEGWADAAALRRAVVGSFRCQDPWIGGIYEVSLGRAARGRNLSGECNPILYGDGTWTGASLRDQYRNLENLIGATQTSLAAANWEFAGVGGDMEVARPASAGGGTVRVSAGDIRFADLHGGRISTSAGNVIAPGGGNVIAPGGGNVISPDPGRIAVLGGAAVIASGGANVIAAGGANVIAAGGGN